jgi:hypothetical protein
MKLLLSSLLACLLALATSAEAQRIEPLQASATVSKTAELAQLHYVDEARRAQIAQRLEESRASGRYATTDPRLLANRVTEDLRAVTNDGHMSLQWDPATYTRLVEEAGSAVPPQSRSEEESVRINHGLGEMRILPGNVRYLRISAFAWVPDRTGAAYDAAMAFLREGDAVIIDLRDNNGGNASAVRYAISHFMPANNERLLMNFQDESGAPDQSRVLGYLPAGRITGRPLIVLVNGNTVSAAEEFAYHVRQFRLGRLVGAKTAGAANNNHLYPVAPGFVASISVFRPTHPVGSSNWEGTGIAPDIEAAPAHTLRLGHVAALEELTRTATGARQFEYAWELARERAPLQPPLPASRLAAYQGEYNGRSVVLEGGRLLYRRRNLPTSEMVPMGDHLFAFNDTEQLRARFRMEGSRPVELELIFQDGNVRRFARTR